MDLARELRDSRQDDPAAAFFGFFSIMVDELAADRGLGDALAGAGIDLEATVAGSGHDVTGMLGALLADAQRAGSVRPDVDLADVKALMTQLPGGRPDAAPAPRRGGRRWRAALARAAAPTHGAASRRRRGGSPRRRRAAEPGPRRRR